MIDRFGFQKNLSVVERKYQEEKDCIEYSGLTIQEIKKKNKDKYYAERVFNNILSEQFGFENHDRDSDETGAGKIELMDLYKNGTMFAVKIGNSSAKLSYVVEQSISSTRMYKHHLLSNMPRVDKVADNFDIPNEIFSKVVIPRKSKNIMKLAERHLNHLYCGNLILQESSRKKEDLIL